MKIVLAAGALAALAGVAQAGPSASFFTFDDPSTDLEVHLEPGAGNNGWGLLTFNGDIPIDFEVNGTAQGYGLNLFNGASFTQNVSIGPVTQVGNTFFAPAEGSFEFRDNGGNLILSGSYVNANIALSISTGTIFASGAVLGGDMQYTAHGQLLSTLQGVFGPNAQYLPPVDGSWTLSAITGLSVDQDNFFNAFDANAAFTGTAVAGVPTPGAAVLAGVAGLAVIRRRRA